MVTVGRDKIRRWSFYCFLHVRTTRVPISDLWMTQLMKVYLSHIKLYTSIFTDSQLGFLDFRQNIFRQKIVHPRTIFFLYPWPIAFY